MSRQSVQSGEDFNLAMEGARRLDWSNWLPKPASMALRSGFSFIAAISDVAAIVVSAVMAGIAYHLWAYGAIGPQDIFVTTGLFVALLFLVATAMRNEYAFSDYLNLGELSRRTFLLWNIAFVGALAFAFLTKTIGDISRATIILFYVGGIASVLGGRVMLAHFVLAGVTSGAIPSRRAFLVGYEAEVNSFHERQQRSGVGMRVIAAAIIRDRETLTEDLALAAASARMLRPDDIYILAPWSETQTLDKCVETFLRVPAEIHLGSERIFDKYIHARVSTLGGIASLNIAHRPLNGGEVVIKRAFDILASGFGLLLLSPLFLLVALAIKWDSAGPVFFMQRRYGFNQESFLIWKFRSMTTMDNGREIQQAKRNDPRITRVGAFLRRTNIDELPQLINVLLGDMSLVGPRPHAMAHDQKFERSIAFYARRHNMKPGITGWAQVNGCRGETDTPEKMSARISYDLHYIDHWSFVQDLKIIWLTIFSKKAYRNAI